MASKVKSIKVFEIVLENRSGSYFAGQRVKGHLILDLGKGVKSKGVKINFRGETKVKCNVRTPGTPDYFHLDGYKDSDVYFNKELYFIGGPGGPEVEVTANGRHEFPFSFELPLDIPSSFEGSNGYVKYSLTGTLHKVATTTKMFTVNAIVDLNKIPGAEEPVHLTKEKRPGILFRKDGPISFVLKLDRKGFVPGEALGFTVEMSNQSSKVGTSEIILKRKISFHVNAREESKSVKDNVMTIIGPSLNPGTSLVWTENPRDVVRIPPIPPTDLGGCRIILVQYSVQVRMVFPSFILKGSTPITIGTVPFKSSFEQLRRPDFPPPSDSERQEAAGGQNLTPPHIAEYPDLPPPSYEDFHASDGLPTYEEVEESDSYPTSTSSSDFVLRYASYNWA